MGHDALGLGDRDLALGIDALKKLEKKARFPFLNANVVDVESNELLFQESVLLEAGGQKVGVFALLSNAYRLKASQESAYGFKVLSPQRVAGKIIADLKSKGAQIIVLLGHLTLEECAEVAREFPEIDVILGSQSQKMKRYPDTVGNTYITDPYMKGKYLGILTLFIHPDEKEFVFGDPGRETALKGEIRELEVRIESRSRALESAEKSNAAGEKRDTTWLEKNLKDTRLQLDQAKEKLAALDGGMAEFKSFITYDYPGMGKGLEDDEVILQKVEAFKKKYPNVVKTK